MTRRTLKKTPSDEQVYKALVRMNAMTDAMYRLGRELARLVRYCQFTRYKAGYNARPIEGCLLWAARTNENSVGAVLWRREEVADDADY